MKTFGLTRPVLRGWPICLPVGWASHVGGWNPMVSRLTEQAASCKELARRARRLAGALLEGPARRRLLRYAAELDDHGTSLGEKTTTSDTVH